MLFRRPRERPPNLTILSRFRGQQAWRRRARTPGGANAQEACASVTALGSLDCGGLQITAARRLSSQKYQLDAGLNQEHVVSFSTCGQQNWRHHVRTEALTVTVLGPLDLGGSLAEGLCTSCASALFACRRVPAPSEAGARWGFPLPSQVAGSSPEADKAL